jgi:hypothetical protein
MTKRREAVPWVAEAARVWGELSGAVAPGRIGRALKPLVDGHGWPTVEAALRRYLARPGAHRTPETLALNWRYWHTMQDSPAVVDETGELTPYGEQVWRSAQRGKR